MEHEVHCWVLLILQAWTNHSWAQNHGYQGLPILYEPLLLSYIILQITLSLVYNNHDVIACIYTELLIHYVVAFLLNILWPILTLMDMGFFWAKGYIIHAFQPCSWKHEFSIGSGYCITHYWSCKYISIMAMLILVVIKV